MNSRKTRNIIKERLLDKNFSLGIETRVVAEDIQSYIRRLVAQHAAGGVIIGLSGGIDSAVLTALAVRAIGKEKVYVWYLYDRDSGEKSAAMAQLLVNSLQLQLHTHNIESAMKEQGVYKPVIMKICALAAPLNNLLLCLYKLCCRGTPVLWTLQKNRPHTGGLKSMVSNHTIRPVEDAFNARHIYRRCYIQQLAARQNLLPLGAQNQSEYMLGWFVKEGIDDLPFCPLIGLYKTQIFQLAEFLQIPAEIRSRPPSPDMLKGITDERAIGLSYSNIDVILDGLAQNLSEKQIISLGIKKKHITYIRNLIRHAAWKRTSENDACGNRLR